MPSTRRCRCASASRPTSPGRAAGRPRRPAPPAADPARAADLGRGGRPGDRRRGAGAVRPRSHLLARRSCPSSPFFTSTNGLASGTHPVEAALHGLCELIEGDAVTLFERLPPEARAARQIDAATIDDPAVAGILARLAGRGFALALWDATTDVGVPTLLLRAHRRRGAADAGRLRLRLPPGPRRRGAAGDHRGRADPGDRHRRHARRSRPRPLRSRRAACASAARWRAAGGGARPWAARPDRGARPACARICARRSLRSTAAGCGPVLAVELAREPRLCGGPDRRPRPRARRLGRRAARRPRRRGRRRISR